MKVEAHILAYQEEFILPFTILHYATFCSRIVIHDLGSTDGTLDIAHRMGATIRQHDSKGEFNDMLNKRIKEECWKGTDADWVGVFDTDEMLYFPAGAEASLASYSEQRLPIIKPYGYDMYSPVSPTTKGQLYDELKMGARDDRWGAKPVLLSPKLVKHVEFSTGAHTATATLHNGRPVTNPAIPSNPPCYLLHWHHIHPIDQIAAKYDAARARYSELNKRHNWGTTKPGMVHAIEKRDGILSKLERVIP